MKETVKERMKETILYSAPGCPQCMMLEEMLKRNHIPYVKCADMDKAIQEKGITAIPMLEADGEMMNYFSAFQWVNRKDTNN